MMNNPDFMRQAASMMGGDPANMQNMMSNPSLSGLMNNPDMIGNALNMLKDPKNRGMLDMMKQQNPNMNVDMMIKGIEVVAKVAGFAKAAK